MDSAVRSSLGYAIAHPGKEPNDLEEGLAETKKQLKDWRAEYEAMVQHPYKKNGKPLKPSTIKNREREVRRLERRVADYHAAMKLYEEIMIRVGARPETREVKREKVAYLRAL